MKIGYFYMTSKGLELVEKLNYKFNGTIFPKENFKETVEREFNNYEALIFVMATGIVVRTIAPFIKSKTFDPAILVLDQSGKFVISLLSGHIGGANKLCIEIAEYLEAAPVITTATDTQGVISFDEYAKENNLAIENIGKLKFISSDVLENNVVDVITDYDLHFKEKNINVVKEFRGNTSVVIHIGKKIDKATANVLYLRPKIVYIGTGCKKNTDSKYYEECFLDFLTKNNISLKSVKTLATIDLKAEENCILNLCEKYGLQLIIVEKDKIKLETDKIEVSDFVTEITGVGSVAEGSALVASENGHKLVGKVKYQGITFSAYAGNIIYGKG